MTDIRNDFADYIAELEARAKAEIAKEDAAWAALPQAEKDRILAEREAKYFTHDIPDSEECCEVCGYPLDHCECGEDDE